MKIAYVITWDMGSDDGVVRKVEAQTMVWREFGHEVKVFAITQRTCVRPKLAEWCIEITRDAGGLVPGKVQLGKFLRSIRANFKLADLLSKWEPDVTYLRYQSYIPGIGFAMDVAPTVVEINSDDLSEAKIYSRMWGFKSKLRQWYNQLTRGLLLRKSTAIVAMTLELLENRGFASYKKLGFVCPNSVAENKIRTLSRAPDLDSRPMLILTASGGHTTEKSHWHGVDKVLELAGKTVKTLRFMIVGADLVVSHRVPENVEVVGHVSPDKLAELYARADVAFGTLALHRKEMNEACAFKVRDALQYGLPVISGCIDTAVIDRKSPWWLELPNTEQNLLENVSLIVEFCYKWRGRRINPEEIIPLISMNKWEAQKLSFMKQFI